MAITHGTPTTAAATGAATAVTLTKPSGLANGDVLYAVVTTNTTVGNTISSWTATGFTKIVANDADTSTRHYAGFRKVITDAGSEPADYTFTFTGSAGQSGDVAGIAWAVTGADTTTPEDVVGTPTASNITTITFNGVTTVTDGAHFIGLGGILRSPSITFNAPMTEIAEMTSTNATVASRTTAFVGYMEQATAGATGAQTATSTEARNWESHTFAIRPAAGGTNATATPAAVGASITLPSATADTPAPTPSLTSTLRMGAP